MGRRYRGVQRPVPERVRAWADPAVFELVELVGRLDVSGIEAAYRADGVGGVPYDPRLMLVTVIWCYRQGVRSPHAIARACREQVSLRVVWQRDGLPSAAALRRFISRHPDGWQQIAVSLLAVCDQAGLVDVSLTATDSTPMAAPAALAKTYTAARITVLIDEAEQDLARVRARLQTLAGESGDITGFVEQGCGPLRRAEQWLLVRLDRLHRAEARARDLARQHRAGMLDSVRCWQDRVDKHTAELAAMTELQNHKVAVYQAKVAAGRKPRGPAPRPAQHHPHVRQKQQAVDRARARLTTAQNTQDTRAGPGPQASTTDPSSRILKGKNTVRWVLGRLLTLTVTAGQLILAPVLSPAANDYAGLFPNLAATATACRQAGITGPYGHHLADAGFADTQTLTGPAPIGGTLLIAVTNEHNQTHGRTRNTHTPHRQQMTERLNTPEGQALYRRRTPMIEPVFAHLLRTDRRLHTRGHAQHTEILAITTAYNTGKYLKAHHKRRITQ